MNTELWDLFWTTGMPEAWLMSREGAYPRSGGGELENGREPPAPPTLGPSLGAGAPGNPGRMY